MYQRADERPDPNRNSPTPIDQQPEVRRSITADQEAAGQLHREPMQRNQEGVDQMPGNVTPIGAATPRPTPTGGSATSERTALFRPEDAERFRSHWTDVQAGFVDEPRHAVEQADELVASVIQRLSEVFTDERTKLEKQWDRGEDVSTEDLRIALQRYRSFFDRLLTL
jgi:hypothetical protein